MTNKKFKEIKVEQLKKINGGYTFKRLISRILEYVKK